jgi:hypothetical protein
VAPLSASSLQGCIRQPTTGLEEQKRNFSRTVAKQKKKREREKQTMHKSHFHSFFGKNPAEERALLYSTVTGMLLTAELQTGSVHHPSICKSHPYLGCYLNPALGITLKIAPNSQIRKLSSKGLNNSPKFTEV